MAYVELEIAEWNQVINILATTKDHPWVITNPLLSKIGDQLRKGQPNVVPPSPDMIKREQEAFDRARGFADGKEKRQ